jgi:hypothetical protein
MHIGTVADAELEMLQHESFSYFLHEMNPNNGLVIDKTAADWPASIAATGFALAAYPVAVERGFMPRAAAVERTLTSERVLAGVGYDLDSGTFSNERLRREALVRLIVSFEEPATQEYRQGGVRRASGEKFRKA